MTMKVLPINKYSYRVISEKDTRDYLDKTLDLSEEDIKNLRARTHRFSDDLKSVVLISEGEVREPVARPKINRSKNEESQNKYNRSLLMDAYRKYQASVNYGEMEKDKEIDDFIQKLKDKDWSVLDKIPQKLLYFMGGSRLRVRPEPSKSRDQLVKEFMKKYNPDYTGGNNE